MAETAEYTEKRDKLRQEICQCRFPDKSIVDAISHATCAMAIDVDAEMYRSQLTDRTYSAHGQPFPLPC